MAGQHWKRASLLLLVFSCRKSVVSGPRLSFGTRWGSLGVEGNGSQNYFPSTCPDGASTGYQFAPMARSQRDCRLLLKTSKDPFLGISRLPCDRVARGAEKVDLEEGEMAARRGRIIPGAGRGGSRAPGPARPDSPSPARPPGNSAGVPVDPFPGIYELGPEFHP